MTNKAFNEPLPLYPAREPNPPLRARDNLLTVALFPLALDTATSRCLRLDIVGAQLRALSVEASCDKTS
jgi:hypothetical protein